MPTFCTKRFISAILSPRSIVFFDQGKPFDLILKYKRMTPRNVTHQYFAWIKHHNIRVSDKTEADKILSDLKNGHCFTCGSTDKCKYINPDL